MTRSALDKGFLIRGITVAAILGCGLYFAFGLAAVAASAQPGTAIHHYEPVSLGLLWHEVSKTSFGLVVRWFRQIDDIDGVVIVSTLTAWFSSALLLALLLAVVPGLFARSPTALTLAGLVLVMGIPFGGFGLFSLFFTFLNAFALRGLDRGMDRRARPSRGCGRHSLRHHLPAFPARVVLKNSGPCAGGGAANGRPRNRLAPRNVPSRAGIRMVICKRLVGARMVFGLCWLTFSAPCGSPESGIPCVSPTGGDPNVWNPTRDAARRPAEIRPLVGPDLLVPRQCRVRHGRSIRQVAGVPSSVAPHRLRQRLDPDGHLHHYQRRPLCKRLRHQKSHLRHDYLQSDDD